MIGHASHRIASRRCASRFTPCSQGGHRARHELLCALAAVALPTRWLARVSATLGIPSLVAGAVAALL